MRKISILALYCIVLCLLVVHIDAFDTDLNHEKSTISIPENDVTNNSSPSTSVDSISEVATDVGSTATSASVPKVRLVTKEELEQHDGKQTDTMWVSIMSQVFDVTAGPEYYSENGPYRIFVARDGNVPFLTGVFTPEEAAKPITELDDGQLGGLQEWLNFYIGEDKYPFIGYLVGDLYDENGKRTEMFWTVEERIEAMKVRREERQRKTKEMVERRTREDAEKKKQAAEKKARSSVGRKLLSYISSLFQRGNNGSKEL